jgi:hypothetical protein
MKLLVKRLTRIDDEATQSRFNFIGAISKILLGSPVFGVVVTNNNGFWIR